ncbi:MAG: putative sugar O-methyltransferase [Chlamydiales bacterium]|nr:putative sugar O-methyltransferase [Chlamydiales bacterium]
MSFFYQKWVLFLAIPLLLNATTSITEKELSYRDICLKASQDPSYFESFRSLPEYTRILEISNGLPFVKYLLSHATVDILSQIETFRKLDQIGSPILSHYPAVGTFSATTLRYIAIANDIQKRFNLPENAKIVEIGAGFGGQCYILSKLFSWDTYSIYDLPEPSALIDTVVEALEIPGVQCLSPSAPYEGESVDLLISNYAYSECDFSTQMDYLEKVIKKARRGYLIYNQISNLFSIIFKTQNLFSLSGESSYPYLSGYSWAFFCDFRLLNPDYGSGPEDFDPETVRQGDTVFVDYTCLELFAKEYLPKIRNKILLVTANYGYGADSAMPGPYAYLLEEEKIAYWFLQNIDREASEKLIPIPIGLANKHFPHGNTHLLDQWIPIALQKKAKSIRTYLNFSLRPEREDCVHYFQKMGIPFFEPTKPFASYLQDLSESLFVISPPGNGVDCHRTWEALLMGCYPVVKSSWLNPLYEDLPVVIVQNWEEVTENFLKEKAIEFKRGTWKREKLYATYWFEKLRDIQKKIRSQEPTYVR